MYRLVLAIASGLAVTVLAGAPTVSAASLSSIKAQVPFAFEVNGVLMPAGEYVVEQPSLIDPQNLVITGTDGVSRSFYVKDVTLLNGFGQADLVFNRYGERAFLHAIRLPGKREALVATSHAELLAASQPAARGQAAFGSR